MPRKKNPTDALLKELRAFGLAYPGAHTKSPWPGHLDLAVKDKTFCYLSVEGEPFGISCKLPQSNAFALMLPFTKPTAYGLGKSGWVSASIPDGEEPPVELFKEWIDESYRAQAPKRLVAALDAGGEAATNSSSRPAAKAARAATKKPAAKTAKASKKPAAKTAKASKKPAAKTAKASKKPATKAASKKPRAPASAARKRKASGR